MAWGMDTAMLQLDVEQVDLAVLLAATDSC